MSGTLSAMGCTQQQVIFRGLAWVNKKRRVGDLSEERLRPATGDNKDFRREWDAGDLQETFNVDVVNILEGRGCDRRLTTFDGNEVPRMGCWLAND